MFINIISFILAHWLFAFKYWAISWWVELFYKRQPQNTYDTKLNALNIVVTFIIILIPVICWVLYYCSKSDRIYLLILDVSDPFLLALSCGVLIWGFHKMVKAVDAKDHIVNKSLIGWHILAYLLIIIALIAERFTLTKTDVGIVEYKATILVVLVINLASSIILALIIY